MIGSKLAHYEILRELGRGGMGQVFLARDTRLDRNVALKVLPEELAGDPDRLARFEREAKTLASLSHPNIVTIFSVEETDGVRFMTMELVEGTTLDEHIPDNGMEMRDFVRLAESLADAVSAAHERGIHHRDLKPANVMVTGDGRVKVLDFGLAKLRKAQVGDDEATQLLSGEFTGERTAEGKIVGTIAYMSPEQAQGGSIDHRSDIFSLGILMYEMVSGKRPFDGPNNISVLSSILKDEPRSISDVREKHDVPLPLARIIHRALAKRPDDRYQSARDLKQDLADLRADLSGELASGLHSGVYTPPHQPKRLLRAGLVVAGGVLLAAAAMFATGLFPGGGRGSGGTATVSSRSDLPSVAVLPFDNLTADPELDWLRHGLPEMLVTDLSQSHSLRVMGTDRVHSILERSGLGGETDMAAVDVRAVGREAGVGMLIVGSFVRAGGELRIDARVEDAASSEVLASERVSGSADAVFDLVDELSGRIRQQVGMTGMPDEMVSEMAAAGMGDKDLTEVTTGSVEAYRLYATAQRRLQEGRPLDAVPLLERALELDPEFGMAWAKLSVALGNSGQTDEALAAAERAFQLSDDMPLEEQLYVRGRFYSFNPATVDESIEAYERAAELFPENSAVRNNLGVAYMNLGRYDDATRVLTEALAAGSEFVGAHTNLAQAHARSGRLDEAIGVLREYLELEPGAAAPRTALAGYLVEAGRLDEAIAEAEAAADIDGGPEARGQLISLYLLTRDREGLDEQVARLENDAETPGAVWLATQARARQAAFQGHASDFFAIFERYADGQPVGSARWAQAIGVALGGAQELPDPARLDRLSDALEAAGGPPGAQQNVPISRMIADSVRGDADAARGHALEFLRVIQEVEVPEPLRVRFNGLLDGLIAKGASDEETALEALQTAWDAIPAVQQPDMALLIAYNMGETNFALSRHEQAREWFERVEGASLEKTFAPFSTVRTHWYLGKIAAERGDRADALRHYREFLAFWGGGEIDRERVDEARRYVEQNG